MARASDAQAFIASEKKALLALTTGGNAQALMSIRDTSLNDAAGVHAAMALEEIQAPRSASGVAVNLGVAVKQRRRDQTCLCD
jgi:hypothetical protein